MRKFERRAIPRMAGGAGADPLVILRSIFASISQFFRNLFSPNSLQG